LVHLKFAFRLPWDKWYQNTCFSTIVAGRIAACKPEKSKQTGLNGTEDRFKPQLPREKLADSVKI
jgi:hypothetical protein